MPIRSSFRTSGLTRGWAWALGGIAVVAACSGEAPVRVITSGLTAPRTVTLQNGVNGYAGMVDTSLSQNAPTTNFGGSATLWADGDDPNGSGRDVSILLRWDLAGVPVASEVQAVSLTVRVTDGSSNSYPLMALARAWSESSATWQAAMTGVPWQTAGAVGGGDRSPVSLAAITPTSTGTLTIPLNGAALAQVKTWVDDPQQNFGFVIASSSNNNGMDIASSEHATLSYRPTLTVTFAAPDASTGGASGASGGASGFGGAPASGGAPGSGGAPASGGAPGSGGAPTFGGAPGSGGMATGGDGSGAGGVGGMSVGGNTGDAGVDLASSGGAPGLGGGPGLGGASGLGGAPGTGGAAAPVPAVLFAAGDVGDCAETGDTATGLLLDGSTDPIALLGDIGYPNGTASDLATCFGVPWGRHKPRIRPAPGNHEYLSAGAAPYFAYFGAAAGDPAKGYYSYDLGAWHVVAINSNCGAVSCSAGSTQEQWLRQDLAAHPAACTLAYWHHPRYNSGHHGAATNMTPIWQALLDHGADVVLSGHEHGYQRWKPMNAANATVANGITEFVVGTGGTTLAAFTNTRPSNNVVRNATTPGVLKLTLAANQYSWQFLPISGKTFTDQGTAACH